MAKLPEGRSTLTDEQMIGLTHRLVDTCIDCKGRIEELEAENHLLKASGIAEVAVRNPNVMEYMKHWEGRAEAAEAKLAKAVEALAAWKHYDESDEQDHVSLMLNYADAIEKTRTTLAELKGEK